MVNELDFEELDQVMEDMSNLDGITDAIAQDVAKIDSVVKKTTPKKPKTAKSVVKNTTVGTGVKKSVDGVVGLNNVVKNTTNKASKSSKENGSGKGLKNKAAPKADTKTSSTKAKSKNNDKSPDNRGEIVLVKVKKPPIFEEEVVFQPNPKVGKFMDIVSPLSDMSITGARPSKNDVKITTPSPILIAETSVAAATITVPSDDFVEKDDLVADRERIAESGLDPDASIGDLADKLEDIPDEEPEDVFDDILQSLADGGDQPSDETADDVEEELEKLADILDIPDHSDAFLENVEIAKRPLGGGEEAVGAIGATAVDSAELGAPDSAETKADKEFIEDSKIADEWLDNQKQPKPARKAKLNKAAKKAQKQEYLKHTAKKSNNVVLYVLLIVLFAILGASLGVLAFFSGLF
ncbi:MAG: hypothetical protein LBU20_02910 [Candidatus Nomurabacteria bacterium]|jgi:hypothetical protein|nr:hypothetical protein [Candidatus Nomurabacteria bacterium]